ncbi:MAG: hypothetical protein H7175_19175, partial [Burkholderiales bacterium]|nr:hypothetical protein [Anaerolineae bacterium]
DKDPTEARYYVLMGLWVRAFGPDFITMRVFSLVVAGITVLIAAAAFWRAPDMTALQKVVSVVALIGLSTFVRTSHELLQDIGTATYGALALLCWLLHERSANTSLRWPFLMGLSLYVGLETIPTLAPVLALTLGLALIVKAVPPPTERREWRKWRWQPIIIYGIGGALAIAVFLLEHFTPDPTLKLEYFNRFTDAYGGVVRSRFTRVPWDVLYLPQNMTTSPVELLAVLVGIIAMLRSGTNVDRWIGAVLLVSLLLTNYFVTGAYSYLVMWSPFVAYLIGRACRGQTGVLVGVFVLLTGMVSAPIYDMGMTTVYQQNQRELTEVDLLTWRIPENSVVLGEDVFFYTLNSDGRYFIGYRGLSRYSEATHNNYDAALETLGVDIIICFDSSGRTNCPQLTPAGFDEPYPFDITRGRYWVYQRSPA